ncbi:MAG: selenocysteine-specific translation elongation factor [Nitriliruptoraceae bacterium]
MSVDHRVIVTAGHVDHGKSTLVRALTGMEPDRLGEEKRRGLSIELGFVWGQLVDGGPTIAFVDVPGHERFIATMLFGAGPAPAAMFVVAADDGWSAQSSEHADALDLLEVPVVAVVVTKAALVSDERVAEVLAQIAARAEGTVLAVAPVVVVDTLAGRGIDELAQVLSRRIVELPKAADDRRPRLWVDRAFSAPGAGTVVTGTLGGGALSPGDHVRVMPSGSPARIRSLQSLGTSVDRAKPGHRVAINLAGVDLDDVHRGDAIIGAQPWTTTSQALAWLRTLHDDQVGRVGAWHIHIGTADTTCRIDPLGEGDTGIGARLIFDRPMALMTGDRFVLRDAGRRAIVAGGTIVDASARRRPRRKDRAAVVTMIASIAGKGGPHRLEGLVGLTGGWRRFNDVVATAGWPADQALPAGLSRIGAWIVTNDEQSRWATAVAQLGSGTHRREHIVSALWTEAQLPEELTTAVVDDLVDRGTITRLQGGYVLAEHASSEDAATQQRIEGFLADLERSGLAPDNLDVLASRHGLDYRHVTTLAQQGLIVRFDKFALSTGAINTAVEELARTVAINGREFTASEAREAWNTSRKYAIPLLEHLDRTGVTRFDGQLRTLVGSGAPGR